MLAAYHTAAPSGGWGRALGVPDATPLTQAHITAILAILERAVRADPNVQAFGMIPGGFLIVEQKIRDTRAAAENALRLLIGQPIGSVAADLSKLPGVKQPDDVGSFAFGTGAGSLIGDAIAGVGDVVTHGALLVGIVALIILGAATVFRAGPGAVGKLAGGLTGG